jgi:23S rRNA (guanosine2251-2'-O)-methyltransferase
VVILDGVEDPHNLGAVLRTAEAAGVHGVFLPERRSVGLTASVAKASAGALEFIQVARCTNVGKLVQKCQEKGVVPLGFDPSASTPFTALDLRGPVALVFGVEGRGIRPGVLTKCEGRATIPMVGRIQSLNLSVAVGVVLFEALRQRGSAGRREKNST